VGQKEKVQTPWPAIGHSRAVHPQVVGSWERGLQSLCENSSHGPVIKKSTLTFGSGRVFIFDESVSNHIFILQNRVFAFFTQALNGALRYRQLRDAPANAGRILFASSRSQGYM